MQTRAFPMNQPLTNQPLNPTTPQPLAPRNYGMNQPAMPTQGPQYAPPQDRISTYGRPMPTSSAYSQPQQSPMMHRRPMRPLPQPQTF